MASTQTAYRWKTSDLDRLPDDRATSVSYGDDDTLSTPLLPGLSLPARDFWPQT